MRLQFIWLFLVGLLVFVILYFFSGPLSRLFHASQGWNTVQVFSLGFSLRVPESASVHFYKTEGVLRVEIGHDQVLSVRVAENPGKLSASAWSTSFLDDKTRRGIDPLVPMIPVMNRQVISLSGQTAETFQLVGPVTLSRRTVLVDGERTFLIDYPAGDGASLEVFDQIRASFQAGVSGRDSGFQLEQPQAGDNIDNLPVPYYSQTDPRWRCDQFGTCNCFFGLCAYYTGIGDAGCYITSEAMIFDYYTGHYKDPSELNECLTQNDGYGLWSGCTWGLCQASYEPISSCKPNVIQYENINGNLDVLDQDLTDGYPGLAWVDGGTHYVVIIGKKDGLYQILDPLYARTEIWPGEIIYYVRYHGPLPAPVTATPVVTFTPTATATATPFPFYYPPGKPLNFLPFQINSSSPVP